MNFQNYNSGECPQCEQLGGMLIDDQGRPWWACENNDCLLYQYPYLAQSLECSQCNNSFYVDQHQASQFCKGRIVLCPACNNAGTLGELITDYLLGNKSLDEYPRPDLWRRIQQSIGPDPVTSAKMSNEEVVEHLKMVAQEHPDVKAAANINVASNLFLATAYKLDLEDVIYVLERWHNRVSPDQIAFIASAAGEGGLFTSYVEDLQRRLLSVFYTQRTYKNDTGVDARLLPEIDTHLFDDSLAAKMVILSCFYVYHYDRMAETIDASYHCRDLIRDMLRKGENKFPVRYLFFQWDLRWVPFVDRRHVDRLFSWVQNIAANAAPEYLKKISNGSSGDDLVKSPAQTQELPVITGSILFWEDNSYVLTKNQKKVMEVYIKLYTSDPDAVLKGVDVCQRVDVLQTQLRKVFDDGSRPAWELFEQTKRGHYRLVAPSRAKKGR